MRKMILILVLGLNTTLMMFAQNNNLEGWMQKYAGKPSISTLSFSGFSLKMVANKSADEIQKQILGKINSLHVLIGAKGHTIQKSELTSFIKQLQKLDYELFSSWKSGTKNVEVYVKENHKQIESLFLIARDKEHLLIIELNGNLEKSDLQYLDLQIEGAELIKKAHEHKVSQA